MKHRLGLLALLTLSVFSSGCCGWMYRCGPGYHHWWHHDR
jgi:hypothetical protein